MVLSIYLAEKAEENTRDGLSLGRDLKAGPSEHERVGLTFRPCKNERRNQKDPFIPRKQGNPYPANVENMVSS
jgi:hypothetical protein